MTNGTLDIHQGIIAPFSITTINQITINSSYLLFSAINMGIKFDPNSIIHRIEIKRLHLLIAFYIISAVNH